MSIHAVILAGGEGTRFAPISTPEKPKQFLFVTDSNRTMIQQCCDRLSGFVATSSIYVSTNNRYTSHIESQLPEVGKENILGEPLKKNTAPAIAFCTALIAKVNPKAIVFFLPSDQFIADVSRQNEIFKNAAHFLENQSKLAIFGVTPTFPCTDYGYIHREKDGESSPYRVLSFKEKPNIETAKSYIQDQQHLWNAGIFAWRGDVFLENLLQYAPEIHRLVTKHVLDCPHPLDEKNVRSYFEACPSISIDYALMEKADNIVVFPFDVGWSDVGTWKGLFELKQSFGLKLPLEIENHLRALF